MTRPAVLTLLTDSVLRDEVDRVTAAVDVGVVHAAPTAPVTRKTWSAAGAVVLDEDAARRGTAAALPRRSAVFLVTRDGSATETATFEAAIAVGAERVYPLPRQATDLVRVLAAVSDIARPGRRGPVVAVMGGRGGAGTSVFCTALAFAAADPGALLIDLDPWGGGIDLLVGGESAPGLRWPDIAVRDGRLMWSALREALPRHDNVSVLSGDRRGHDVASVAVDAVVDAGRRGGATVVCDLPRRITDVTQTAIDAADLVVLMASCDVRSCAAAAAAAPALTAITPNVGVVVRGPAPGGLRPGEVADIIGLPLLAAMRPEPLLPEKLERGGIKLRARSPLATAARQIVQLLATGPERAA